MEIKVEPFKCPDCGAIWTRMAAHWAELPEAKKILVVCAECRTSFEIKWEMAVDETEVN